MQDVDLPRLMTIPAASRALGISSKLIRQAVERGDLEVVRLSDGAWPRVAEASLRQWLSMRIGPASP